MHLNNIFRSSAFSLMFLAISGTSWAAAPAPRVAAALQSLEAATGGTAQVVLSTATGTARRVVIEPSSCKARTGSLENAALSFLSEHAGLFGLRDVRKELSTAQLVEDTAGFTHVNFSQISENVPVFGSMLRVHFDANGQLVVVNGLTIPGVHLLKLQPSLPSHAAQDAALIMVLKTMDERTHKELQARSATLYIFRTGLARGVPGTNHLAWEVEIGNGSSIRELVYIDAHNGQLLDRISGTNEIRRTVYRTTFGNTVWSEGNPLPFTGSGSMSIADVDEVNTLIDTAEQTYNLFLNISGGSYRSFNGADGTMHSVQDSTELDCPNAQWNGRNTQFCFNMVADDIVAHEWAHAYTGSTHALIYQWQPGALNESYSDIFGEVVDLLNGSGTDAPSLPRADNECSALGGSSPPLLTIEGPPEVAGAYSAGDADFNPNPPWTARGELELVNDDQDTTSDACTPLVGFGAGHLALVDRGICTFREKVLMAQAAGAVGVIVINNQGDDVLFMNGDLPRLGIPALFIGQGDGQALKDALGDKIVAHLSASTASDPSLKWLIGEDSFGAIRDMWLPTCYGDPAATSDGAYFCGSDDGGGVHTNSGVPNHAFALIVDGGNFGGEAITGIGITKAVHIYWRAMAHYQVPTTGFADHAALVELSCNDLIDVTLTDPLTGQASAEGISAADCAQVATAMVAVGMAATPARCDFQPLLSPDTPSLNDYVLIYSESFDTDSGTGWIRSNEGVYNEYDPRDWQWTTDLPAGGDGGAFFAIDSLMIGNCQPGSDDQSGVMYLESPELELPAGATEPLLSFDHYVATEALYDGGNLKISVNGGGFELVNSAAFIHNPYNDRLISRGAGNTNPMSGQNAFTGMDAGGFEGSWGQSQVDLSQYAAPGDHVRFRFDFGVDGCNGNLGWYVDNLKLMMRAGPAPRRTTGRVGG